MAASGVIIAGFHHSGTRLVARMLSALGVHQIIDEPTYEWSVVQHVNEVLCPAWCDPDALAAWLESDDETQVDAPHIISAMAAAGYAGGLWGVKDPRLCLTAPAWCRAFPGARLVFIYRDPLTVLGTFPASYAYFTPNREKPSARLDFWSRLYEQYYVSMRRQCLQSADVIELRYEDLVAAPEQSLTRLAAWLGIDAAAAHVARAVTDNPINRMRASHLKTELAKGTIEQSGLDLIRRRLAPVRRAMGYAKAV